MSLLRNSAVALATLPAFAATGAVSQPIEPVAATSWARQLSRSGVHSSRGSYSTSFEINSSRYEIDGAVTPLDGAPKCIVKYVGASVGSNRFQESSDATQSLRFEERLSVLLDPALSTSDLSVIIDAMAFTDAIHQAEWRPSVWKEGDEIVFEWIDDTRHAIVSIEGDGTIAYTMLKDGQFVSGERMGLSVAEFPADLQDYIKSAA